MSKIIFSLIILCLSHLAFAQGTIYCDLQNLIANAEQELSDKSLNKLLDDIKGDHYLVEDSDIISAVPSKKSPPSLPVTKLKVEGQDYVLLNESDYLEVIPVGNKKAPPPLPESPLYTQIHTVKAEDIIYSEQSHVQEILNLDPADLHEIPGPPPLPAKKKGPPPLPVAKKGPPPLPVAKKGPPPLPVVKKGPPPLPAKGPPQIHVFPESQAVIDSMPEKEIISFVAPDGRTKRYEIPKNVNQRLVLKPARPLTLNEFEAHAKAQGKEVRLTPLMKEVKGQKVQAKGGLREVFEDTVEDGMLYKKPQNHLLANSSRQTDANMAKREMLVTQYVNDVFSDLHKRTGIAFYVEPHDYTFADVGYTGIKKVPGKSLFEYRKGLSPEELVAFNKQLKEVEKELQYHQKIVGRMVNREFNGVHCYKGVTQTEMIEAMRQAGNDVDKFVDAMAEKGVLADIDTGLINYENNGLGTKGNLNNCHVYDTIIDGKKYPIIHCYDI